MKQKRPYLLIVLAVAALYLLGGLEALEGDLMDARFRLTKRDAGDGLVVVAIDPKSLRELGVWPWPRDYHATLLERLTSAGARVVAFDVAFSFASTPEADERLSEALAAAEGRVILPVYEQWQRAGDEAPTLVRTEPLPRFRRHVALASINVRPEADGLVRQIAVREMRTETGLPALAALLADQRDPHPAAFYVDFGIDVTSVRRLSYVDVMSGNFDPRMVAGKAVLVGATAVELGDSVPVPVYRALPGSMFQALAYHSLVQGRALHRVGAAPILVGMLILAWFLGPRFRDWSWRRGLGTVAACVAGIMMAALVAQTLVPVLLDTTPWALTILLSYGGGLVMRIDRQAVQLFLQWIDIGQKDEMMRAVVENNFDAILTVDDQGLVQTFNAAAQRLFGYPPSEVVGGHFASLLSAPDHDAGAGQIAPEARRAWRRVLAPGQREFVGRRCDGATMPVEIAVSQATLVASANPFEQTIEPRNLLICTMRDISERKRVENFRKAAKDAAELASRTKTEFLANMSHELRTPLNAILGFSEIMKDEMFGPLGAPQYDEYAEDIHNSATHLLTLISGILDIVKADAGKLDLNESTVKVGVLIDGVVRLMRREADSRGIELRRDVDPSVPPIVADETKLKQVLLNLLSNAIKFTGESGEISVAAGLDPDGNLAITVTDTGIGIAPENIATAMSPFGQVENVWNRKHEGTGLGLPLSKRLVELHGGDLTLVSRLGAGTAVTIELPRSRVLARVFDGPSTPPAASMTGAKSA